MHSCDWPGNIRELENILRSAIALAKTRYLTTREIKDLGTYSGWQKEEVPGEPLDASLIPLLKELLERKETGIHRKIHNEVDKHLFEYMLSLTKDNLSEAARMLGINRLTLRRKLGI